MRHLLCRVAHGGDGLADVRVLLQRPLEAALVVLPGINNLRIVGLRCILACISGSYISMQHCRRTGYHGHSQDCSDCTHLPQQEILNAS